MEAWCHQKASEVVLVCVKCIRKPYDKPHTLAGSGKDSTVCHSFAGCHHGNTWNHMEWLPNCKQLQQLLLKCNLKPLHHGFTFNARLSSKKVPLWYYWNTKSVIFGRKFEQRSNELFLSMWCPECECLQFLIHQNRGGQPFQNALHLCNHLQLPAVSTKNVQLSL